MQKIPCLTVISGCFTMGNINLFSWPKPDFIHEMFAMHSNFLKVLKQAHIRDFEFPLNSDTAFTHKT